MISLKKEIRLLVSRRATKAKRKLSEELSDFLDKELEPEKVSSSDAQQLLEIAELALLEEERDLEKDRLYHFAYCALLKLSYRLLESLKAEEEILLGQERYRFLSSSPSFDQHILGPYTVDRNPLSKMIPTKISIDGIGPFSGFRDRKLIWVSEEDFPSVPYFSPETPAWDHPEYGRMRCLGERSQIPGLRVHLPRRPLGHP